MTVDIGNKARKPNPVLAPLGKLVGTWRSEGRHPLLDGPPLAGRASFAWQDEGAFLVWRSQVDHPQIPDGIAIFGSDDEAGTVLITYFDARGISRKYDVTLRPDGFDMERLTPKFSQRMQFRIEADGSRLVSHGTMSRDGGAWEEDLSMTYERH